MSLCRGPTAHLSGSFLPLPQALLKSKVPFLQLVGSREPPGCMPGLGNVAPPSREMAPSLLLLPCFLSLWEERPLLPRPFLFPESLSSASPHVLESDVTTQVLQRETEVRKEKGLVKVTQLIRAKPGPPLEPQLSDS